MKKLIKILSFILFLIIFVYAMLCGALYLFPELFFNHPNSNLSNLEAARKKGYPAEWMEYKAEDGTELYGWYTKGTNGKVVLFTHGNAFNLDRFYAKLIPFVKAGYATFMPEYRGYGGIRGKINNKNLVMDSVAAVQELYKLGYKNEDIIVYGMSLGSHMATATVYEMNKNGRFDALVLEVPFDNVPNTAKNLIPFYMPFDLLIRERYDNLPLIAHVGTRVLIQAAGRDNIVPNPRAKALYEAAVEPKNFMMYEKGTHSFLYGEANYKDILRWLELR